MYGEGSGIGPHLNKTGPEHILELKNPLLRKTMSLKHRSVLSLTYFQIDQFQIYGNQSERNQDENPDLDIVKRSPPCSPIQ